MSVEPLPSTLNKVDTPIESLPSTSVTPDMPTGMAKVQQLADGTFLKEMPDGSFRARNNCMIT
jgi:hypothetical protein